MTENVHYLKGVSFLYTAAFAQLIAQSLKSVALFFMYSEYLNLVTISIYSYIGSHLMSCIAFLGLISTARSLSRWREDFRTSFLLFTLGFSGYFVAFISFLSIDLLEIIFSPHEFKILSLIIFLANILIFLGYIGLIMILLDLSSDTKFKSLKAIFIFIVMKLFILFINNFEILNQVFLEKPLFGYFMELEFLSGIVAIWIWNLVAVLTGRILASRERLEGVEGLKLEIEVLEGRVREYEGYLARLREMHERGEVSHEVYTELRNFYSEQLSKYRMELEKLKEKLEESGATTVVKG